MPVDSKTVIRFQHDDGSWLSDTETIHHWARRTRRAAKETMSNAAAFEILTREYGVSLSRRRIYEILHELWGDGYIRREKPST